MNFSKSFDFNTTEIPPAQKLCRIDSDQPNGIRHLLRKFHVAQGVCILIANSIVLVAVCRFEFLRTKSNAYIISNTFINLILGVLEIYYGLHFVERVQDFSNDHPAICFGMYYIIYSSLLCSSYHVLFIGIDRFLSVAAVFWYIRNVTERITIIVLGFVWTIAFSTGSLLFVLNVNNEEGIFKCHFYIVSSSFRMFVVAPTFLSIMLIVGILYTTLGLVAHHHRTEIIKQKYSLTVYKFLRSNRSSSKLTSLLRHGAFKGLKMQISIFSLLLLCWLPYNIMELVYAMTCVRVSYHTAAFLLGFFSSIMTVIVYPLCNRAFRLAMKQILLCYWEKEIRYSLSVSSFSLFSKPKCRKTTMESEEITMNAFLSVPRDRALKESKPKVKLDFSSTDLTYVTNKNIIIVAQDWKISNHSLENLNQPDSQEIVRVPSPSSSGKEEPPKNTEKVIAPTDAVSAAPMYAVSTSSSFSEKDKIPIYAEQATAYPDAFSLSSTWKKESTPKQTKGIIMFTDEFPFSSSNECYMKPTKKAICFYTASASSTPLSSYKEESYEETTPTCAGPMTTAAVVTDAAMTGQDFEELTLSTATPYPTNVVISNVSKQKDIEQSMSMAVSSGESAPPRAEQSMSMAGSSGESAPPRAELSMSMAGSSGESAPPRAETKLELDQSCHISDQSSKTPHQSDADQSIYTEDLTYKTESDYSFTRGQAKSNLLKAGNIEILRQPKEANITEPDESNSQSQAKSVKSKAKSLSNRKGSETGKKPEGRDNTRKKSDSQRQSTQTPMKNVRE